MKCIHKKSYCPRGLVQKLLEINFFLFLTRPSQQRTTTTRRLWMDVSQLAKKKCGVDVLWWDDYACICVCVFAFMRTNGRCMDNCVCFWSCHVGHLFNISKPTSFWYTFQMKLAYILLLLFLNSIRRNTYEEKLCELYLLDMYMLPEINGTVHHFRRKELSFIGS